GQPPQATDQGPQQSGRSRRPQCGDAKAGRDGEQENKVDRQEGDGVELRPGCRTGPAPSSRCRVRHGRLATDSLSSAAPPYGDVPCSRTSEGEVATSACAARRPRRLLLSIPSNHTVTRTVAASPAATAITVARVVLEWTTVGFASCLTTSVVNRALTGTCLLACRSSRTAGNWSSTAEVVSSAPLGVVATPATRTRGPPMGSGTTENPAPGVSPSTASRT